MTISDPIIKDGIRKMSQIENELNHKIFVERESELRAMLLTMVANTNILLLGPPGLAKSLIVTALSKHVIKSKYFEHLLTPYTTPDELNGHVSIRALEKDEFTRKTLGKLPEANFAFLDEFFKANSGVINSLLSVMNERKFHNAGQVTDVELIAFAAASNELPEEADSLAAAVDRFIIKVFVKAVTDPDSVLRMMDNYLKMEAAGGYTPETVISLDEIKALQDVRKRIEVPLYCRRLLFEIVDSLRGQNIIITPRSINNSLRVLQANAVLEGRSAVDEEDFEVLSYTLWKEPQQLRIVRDEIIKRASPEKQKLVVFQKTLEAVVENISAILNDKTLKQEVAIPKAVSQIGEIKKLREELETFKNSLMKSNRPTTNVNRLLEKLAQVGDEQHKRITGAFNFSTL